MYGTNLKGPTVPNATYVIDDQEPIKFPDENPSNIINFSNQVFFELGNLPHIQHKLNVTYLGDDTQSLYFNYFVQQNAPYSRSPTSTGNGKFTGAIIGGVIGGIVLIFFIGLFFHRRRNNRRSNAPSLSETQTPCTVPSLGSVKRALLSGLASWQTEGEMGFKLKRMTK